MNRETELHFSQVPELHVPRSKFKIPFNHKTSMNSAALVPIFLEQDVLPGDTISIDMATVIRMATPLYPVMDNAYADIFFFFIPNRLLMEKWPEFWGENKNAWYQTIEYEVPHITTNEEHVFTPNSLADYMGLPTNIPDISVNALPFRAYAKVWNDWFRDENLQQETPNTLSEADAVTDENSPFKGGICLNANKFHDYFTSALPSISKGQTVEIPIGNMAPVLPQLESVPDTGGTLYDLKWRDTWNRTTWANNKEYPLYGVNWATQPNHKELHTHIRTNSAVDADNNGWGMQPANLWADLSSTTSITVEMLRQALAINRFYEAQARTGSRYIEFLKGIFGVTSPDARLQRSEYLGGRRIPINVDTVLQQSSTNQVTPLGQTGAFSHTADAHDYFTKSFSEHGIILGLCTIRYDHSYQQGIERGWSRRKWTDYYLPQFANLSEMGIKVSEIYATGGENDNEIFGYQEAWADYRYKPNLITGQLRSTLENGLDAWHYGDYYEEQPILGSQWIQEDENNVARTLAVTDSTWANQFIADFYFDCTYVRPMPLYSVPGLGEYL